MENQYNPDGFIPKHVGYNNLVSYQKTEIVFDGTYHFCHKYFQKYDRTIDQMIQAARSGKQTIVEGCMVSGTLKEIEIKLTVDCASLEELINDYKDFLRTRKLKIWDKTHPYHPHLTKLHKIPNANYETYRKGIENPDPEVAANVLLSLTNTTSYLLAQQIKTLEQEFLKSIGFRCLQVGVVPAKALTEEKKTNKRNTWSNNFNLD